MAEPAKNKGGKTKPVKKVTRKVTSKAQSSVHGFVDFIRTQGVVGLAIGFMMGTQAQLLIKQFTESIINPTIQLIFGGKTPLVNRTVYIQINSHSATFNWGALVYAVINFMIIAAVIYLVFKWLRLDKLDKKKG
jgi:large conductance mechanosensitive channel